MTIRKCNANNRLTINWLDKMFMEWQNKTIKKKNELKKQISQRASNENQSIRFGNFCLKLTMFTDTITLCETRQKIVFFRKHYKKTVIFGTRVTETERATHILDVVVVVDWHSEDKTQIQVVE